MSVPSIALLSLAVLFAAPPAFAKGKSKDALPPQLLHARTVAVVIEPGTGISLDDPDANQVARKDVEAALINWGRFQPLIGVQSADLIIVIHRANRHPVSETVPDPRQNNRDGVLNPIDNGVMVGAQRGQPRPSSAPTAPYPQNRPTTQTEIGPLEDSFAVYIGDVDHPLDAPPAWRYLAKDALRPHSVPAVDEFRKALVKADKAANQP